MKESLKTRGIHHIRSSFVEEYVNLIMTNKVCRSEYTYVKGCICVYVCVLIGAIAFICREGHVGN